MTMNLERGLWFGGGILVGGVVVLAIYAYPATVLAPAIWERATTTPSITYDISGRIVVDDQAAGMSVIIRAIAIDPPGVWAAVREVKNDNLGNVLGAVRVRSATTNISVPLLRGTVSGRTYAIVLYRENGDDEFTLAGDSVYVDFDTGKGVVASFSAK